MATFVPETFPRPVDPEILTVVGDAQPAVTIEGIPPAVGPTRPVHNIVCCHESPRIRRQIDGRTGRSQQRRGGAIDQNEVLARLGVLNAHCRPLVTHGLGTHQLGVRLFAISPHRKGHGEGGSLVVSADNQRGRLR